MLLGNQTVFLFEQVIRVIYGKDWVKRMLCNLEFRSSDHVRRTKLNRVYSSSAGKLSDSSHGFTTNHMALIIFM